MVIILGAFYLFKNSFLLISAYFQYQFADSAAAHLTKALMKVYLSTSYVNLLSRNSSDLITNISEATNTVSGRILMPLTVVVSESFTILAILVILIASNPVITILSVIFIGFILVAHNLAMSNFYERWQERRLKLEQEKLKITNEALLGLKEVKVYGVAEYFLERFKKARDGIVRVNVFAIFS